MGKWTFDNIINITEFLQIFQYLVLNGKIAINIHINTVLYWNQHLIALDVFVFTEGGGREKSDLFGSDLLSPTIEMKYAVFTIVPGPSYNLLSVFSL